MCNRVLNRTFGRMDKSGLLYKDNGIKGTFIKEKKSDLVRIRESYNKEAIPLY